jgi:nitrogen fixation protein NifU and related proteins
MTNELKELYQQVILDHNKQPRNFHCMEHPDAQLEGYNPLCGDHYTFYLRFEGDVVADVSFEGSGCAISKASASLMSTVVKGKTKKEVEELFTIFHDLVMGKTNVEAHEGELGKLAVFAGVAEFPMRVKCATLPWHTLHGALAGEKSVITSE